MRPKRDSIDDIVGLMNAAQQDAASVAHAYLVEDCGPGAKLAGDYAIQIGLDDYENFDPKDPEFWSDFNEWAKDMAVARVDEEIGRILDEAEIHPDGNVTVWREMIVPTDWIEEGLDKAPIGKCWAWDPSFAEAHQGHGWTDPDRMKVRIKALVGIDGIDWTETLALNAAAEYTVGDEKEIRLLDGSVVEIAVIEWAAFGQSYDEGDPVHIAPGMSYPAGKAGAPSMTC